MPLLNFLVLQWFGVRLVPLLSAEDEPLGWALLGVVLPMSGWWGARYWWVWRRADGHLLLEWWRPL